MRLIDADKLKGYRLERHSESNRLIVSKSIANVPTAYDVEAVVWKLAELRDSFHGGTLQEYYYKGALEMAIDIVKKGGVK